jgi:hypothetical protein
MNQTEQEFFGIDGDLITMDVLTGQMPVLNNQREYSGADGDNFPMEYGYEDELELAEWEDFVDEDGLEHPEYEYAYFEEVEDDDDEFYSNARGRRRKKKRRKKRGLFGGGGRERRQERRAERKSRRADRRRRRGERKDFRQEKRRNRMNRKNQRQDRRDSRVDSKNLKRQSRGRAQEERVRLRGEKNAGKNEAKRLGMEAQQQAIQQMSVVDPNEQAMMKSLMAESNAPLPPATTGMSKGMKTGLIVGGAVVVLLIGVVVMKSMASKNK